MCTKYYVFGFFIGFANLKQICVFEVDLVNIWQKKRKNDVLCANLGMILHDLIEIYRNSRPKSKKCLHFGPGKDDFGC